MSDFIKKNKIVIAGMVTFIVIILSIAAIMFFTSKKVENNNTGTEQPFGNTDTNREFNKEDAFLFGTSSERFIINDTINKKDIPVLRALSNTPTAGTGVFERFKDGLLLQYARFVSTENGHIFETPINKIGEDTIVSKKTILRILNTEISQNANSILMQYYNEDSSNVFNYIAYFSEGTTTKTEIDGHPIVGDIITSSISPEGNAVFYIIRTENGSIGFIENIKTGEKTKLWSSILTSVDTSWDSPNKIIVYTKPSSIAGGAVWMINAKNGEETLLLKKEYALSAKINKTGTKLLYSMQEKRNGIFSLRVLDVKTGDVTHMPLTTISEKCVWGYDDSRYIYCAIPRKNIEGKFLEDWYMGVKNSDDILWRIDTETGTVKRLIDPYEETEEKFDVEKLIVTPDNNYLIFNTRVNKILWSLKLPEKQNTEKENME